MKRVLDTHELLSRRILLEANRVFFHPHGMHIEHNPDGELQITYEGVLVHYSGFTDDDRRAIQEMQQEFIMNKRRSQGLGYKIQPIQSKEARTISRIIEKKRQLLDDVYDDIERLEKKIKYPAKYDSIEMLNQYIKPAKAALQIAKEKEKQLIQEIQFLQRSDNQ